MVKKHLAAAGVLLVIAGLVAVAAARSGRPRVVAEVEGQVLSPPSGAGSWVAWLEGSEEEARLVALQRPCGAPREVARGPGLSGLALSGDHAVISRAAGAEAEAAHRARAELVRVDLKSGAVEVVATTGRRASEIVWGEGWLSWREDWEPGLPGVTFVAAASPMSAIRARAEEGGETRTIAVVSGGTTPEASQADLVGIAGGYVYWLERGMSRRGASTQILRAALPGGRPEALVWEEGRRAAALTGETLVWTAPSLEAAETKLYSSVKRRGLDESEPMVIADWIGSAGEVLPAGGTVYVQSREWLWRLGGERGEQRAVYGMPPGVAATVAAGDEHYLVMRSGSAWVIAKRPLTWWSRVRSALSP